MESVVRALERLERRMGAKSRQVFRANTVDSGCENFLKFLRNLLYFFALL